MPCQRGSTAHKLLCPQPSDRLARVQRPMISNLYKECQLRRFTSAPIGDPIGRSDVERTTRWIPVDDAVIGARVRLCRRDGEWEIVSAPEPALPGEIITRIDPDAITRVKRM